MMTYLWVGLGGALGSIARYWLSGAIALRYPGAFPLGTLVVNVTGSFLIGLYAGAASAQGRLFMGPTVRDFFLAGLCGGYTTFSAFSLQTMTLAQEGDWARAGANAIGSFTLCLAAVWLGYYCGGLVAKH